MLGMKQANRPDWTQGCALAMINDGTRGLAIDGMCLHE